MPDQATLAIVAAVVSAVNQVVKGIVKVDEKYYRVGFAILGAAAVSGWQASGGDTSLGDVLSNAGIGAVAVTGTHTLLKGTPAADALKEIGALLVKVAAGVVKKAG